jgi:DNA recombination protein RmuC
MQASMETALLIVNVLVGIAVLVFLVLRRGGDAGAAAASNDALASAHAAEADATRKTVQQALQQAELRLTEAVARGERMTRETLDAAREQQSRASEALRTELDAKLATNQKGTLERLDAMRALTEQKLTESRDSTAAALERAREATAAALEKSRESMQQSLDKVREATQLQLTTLREENQKKLDEMRGVVDEKLQATLQSRLGEAFKQVSERLEQVHKGLGEMQSIATDVGGLKRVLSNVKARGIVGEVQLENILEQFLAADQLARNCETAPGSNKRVEFAVRMPGKGDGAPVLLPIDSKFPREDYERLLDAHDNADKAASEEAAKALAAALDAAAKDIATKYVDPPNTTDFAILFLPTEGLYAEVLRQPGLVDRLWQRHRVSVAGPTTLAALLQSLMLGFRTLAIEKRSSEVWKTLEEVKREFGKFGDVLDKVKKKLNQASSDIDELSGTRTNVIERKLKAVQVLPESDSALGLPVPTPSPVIDAEEA